MVSNKTIGKFFCYSIPAYLTFFNKQAQRVLFGPFALLLLLTLTINVKIHSKEIETFL